MNRNVIFIESNRIEFDSNGRRVRRLLTDSEVMILHKLIDANDIFGIDSFCYRIV